LIRSTIINIFKTYSNTNIRFTTHNLTHHIKSSLKWLMTITLYIISFRNNNRVAIIIHLLTIKKPIGNEWFGNDISGCFRKINIDYISSSWANVFLQHSFFFFVLCLRNSFIILQCLKIMEGGLNSFWNSWETNSFFLFFCIIWIITLDLN